MEHNQLKDEMSVLQRDLQEGLSKMLVEVGNKLSDKEKAFVQQEVEEINLLIERLKSGLIWLALFGRTSVGKSAVVNSLIGDDLAIVGIEHDLTSRATLYRKDPWMIVDVPGIMGDEINQAIALEEAKKAHGHIFVVDGEPFAVETKLFDLVNNYFPNSPQLVFVNKFDRLQHMTKRDREIVMQRIREKMLKYVKHDEDIIFGSAQLIDYENDVMVRQKLPQLEDRLYADTSTLGQIVNILDPAQRAANLSQIINDKILKVRKDVARQVIKGYAISAIATGFIPFDSLLVSPAMFASLAYLLVKILKGQELVDFDNKKMAIDILKVCSSVLAGEFVALSVADTVTSFLGPVGWFVDWAGLSYYKYMRTLIFGEATLLYITNGFTFGSDAEGAIEKAKKEASKQYTNFSKRK